MDIMKEEKHYDMKQPRLICGFTQFQSKGFF